MSRVVRILMMMVLGTSAAGVMAVAPVVAQPQRHEAAASCAPETHKTDGVLKIEFCGGDVSKFNCFNGNHGNISEPTFILNGCSQNVEFYPLPNETGTPTLCVRGGTITGFIQTDWQSWKMGAC